MKLSLNLTPRAVQDLDDIWNYTVEHWGVDQAETYLREVQAILDQALSTSRLIKPCDAVREGYSRIAIASHVAFVRVEDGRLKVIRILHRRMDFARHL